MDKTTALSTAKRVLEADMACEEGDFDRTGVFVYPARTLTGRRRFPVRSKILAMASFGAAVVLSCSSDRLEWVKANLGSKDRDELFELSISNLIENHVSPDNQFFIGTGMKYLCSPDTFKPALAPAGMEVSVIARKEIDALYPDSRFDNSLGIRQREERPRSLAAVARGDGKIIGIAAASEDSDEMWQVGVDVLPEYRGKGIGAAVVGRVTEAVFEAGKVPYYSTWLANIASRRLAIGVGYRPAWIEAYAADDSERR